MAENREPTYEELLTEVRRLRRRVSELEGIRRNHIELRTSLDRDEARMRGLFGPPSIRQSLDEAGRITEVNDAWSDLLGYPPEEAIGRPLATFVVMEDRTRLQRDLDRLRAHGEVRGVEYMMLRNGGERVRVRLDGHVVRDEAGALLRIDCDLEEALHEVEYAHGSNGRQERLVRVISSMPVMLDAFDENGRVIFWNQECERVTGFAAEEMVGNPRALELIYPDPAYRRHIIETIERMDYRFRDLEFELTCKDGSKPLIAWSNLSREYPIPGWATWAVGVDITERRRAEDALRRSEMRYRQLYESSLDGIVSTDMQGVFQECNAAYEKMLGYSIEELRRLDYKQLTPQTWHAWERDLVAERIIGQGHSGLYEKEYIRKDGTVFPIELSAHLIRDEAGKPIGMWAIARDITERKRAEEAVRTSEARLKSIFQAAPIGIGFVKDRVLGMTNEGLSRMTGYATDELHGQTTRMLYESDEEFERVGKVKYAKIRERGTVSLETRWACKDGRVLDILLSTSAVDPEDVSAGAVFTAVDLSELKRAEEARRQLEAKVQQAQKLESLGVLAGGIAHDFNNLLTGILGNADLALMDVPGESSGKVCIEHIRTAAHRAADLCRQMLAYSGRGQFVIEPVDLNALVREMSHLLEASISKKSLLRFSFDPNLPRILGDATQIRQVVMNLITNASEALQEQSGTITVRTGTRFCDADFLDQAYWREDMTQGMYVFIQVQDTGCGMTTDTLERIFDPFYTTKFTGRGLGLAAVMGIIRGHKGTVHIRSKPQEGTVFTVLLPAQPVEEEVVAGPSLEDTPREGTGTVLIIDDEETVRSVARRTLESAGFAVLEARDGQEGIEIYRRHADHITCVLLDLTMPRLSGEETLRALRDINPAVRIVLTSGYDKQDVALRFTQDQAAEFVQKPFRADTLVGKICAALTM